jgi:hypothetical protein
VTETLASIAEARFDEANRWGKQAGQQLRKRSTLQWDEAAEPKAILQQIISARKISVEGLEQIPHDLWPSTNWQSLPVTHQLALLLAGFGCTYELTNEGENPKLKIVPVPETFQLERTYQMTGNAQQRLRQLQAKYPQVQFTMEGRSVTVVATAEDHFAIRRQLLGLSPFKPQKETEKRYQLTTDLVPFDSVAQKIASNLGLQLKYDPALENIKTKRIEISVQNATREELLEALVKTAGVRYVIEGEALIIRP